MSARRLFLLRHAKSDWPAGVPDHDRPLAPRGLKAAPRMAAYLVRESLIPEAVFVSPARRTQETWDAIEPALPGIAAETVPSLYEAGAVRIRDVVHSAPAGAGSLMLIGHNPGLQDFALQLVGAGEPDARTALGEKFPTAALAVIDLDGDWSDLEWGAGRLERFVTPRGVSATGAE